MKTEFVTENWYKQNGCKLLQPFYVITKLSKNDKKLLTNDNFRAILSLENIGKGVIFMWNSKKSAMLSIVVCAVVAVVLLTLILFGPMIFEKYLVSYRGFAPNGQALQKLQTVFAWCFYPSAAFAGVILYSLIKLLFNIRKEEIFIPENVKIFRTVSWCCFIIAFITLIGGIFYMPFLFVSAAGWFVGVLLRVLKNVMQSAVAIKQENDLMI